MLLFMEKTIDPKQLLLDQFSERQAVNARYSLRAFAKDLGLSAQQLSNILNGNRNLTYPTAIKISDSLALPANERLYFIESVRAKYSKHESVRKSALMRINQLSSKVTNDQDLSLELFKTISNWYHLALVELLKIEPSKKPDWYAKRLKISCNETELALGRLIKLELIEKTKHGFKVRQDTVLVDRGIPTDAVKNFHLQILNHALQAIQDQNASDRYGSSSVLAVRKQDLDYAKGKIQKFRIELAKELTARGRADEVFALSIQYFQVSESENANDKKI